MNTRQIELDALKGLYRQEMKKLYQAVLSGGKPNELRPQKVLVTQLLAQMGQRPVNAAF